MDGRLSTATALLGAALLGCATSFAAWEIERAERHLSDGKPDRALRLTERAIRRHGARVGEREIALHLAALGALGREVEAEAFADFSRRYLRAEDPSHEPASFGPDCRRQDGGELVRAWGRPALLAYRDVGPLSATFEVDERGRVGAIEVLRARDPAAAWLLIQTIADARISATRLARRRERAPEGFPVALCASWSPGQPDPIPPGGIPPGGCIRGFCTHAPGTAPHM